MTAKRRAALGFNVHIGRAAVVAVGGAIDAPEILAKARVDVAFTFDEGAVFHVGQQLAIDKARVLVRDAESRFTERAHAELTAFVAGIDAKVAAAGMVAAAARPPPPLETILKAHPLIHAAEGELYRRIFSEAAARLGARPTRVPGDALAGRISAALDLTPAQVAARLALMGKASGKPWAADQKQATLAAWLALVGT